jgi:hypothetical protein
MFGGDNDNDCSANLWSVDKVLMVIDEATTSALAGTQTLSVSNGLASESSCRDLLVLQMNTIDGVE